MSISSHDMSASRDHFSDSSTASNKVISRLIDSAMFGSKPKKSTDRVAVAIQFMSDLHLERIAYDYTIPRVAPFLILSGDIGCFNDAESYKSWLAKQCEQFEMVFLIAGNHEFYRTTRDAGLEIAANFTQDPVMKGRLHFLNRTRIDIPGSDVTILGCTLHSHIAPDYTTLTNDFAKINEWRVSHHNAEHELDKSWLKSTLSEMCKEESPHRVIIATHYAPAFQKTTHPKNENSALSQCFSSHILRESKEWPGRELVKYWTFGHTHWNTKFGSGNITVWSNQLLNDSNANKAKLLWWQKHLYRPFDPAAVMQL